MLCACLPLRCHTPGSPLRGPLAGRHGIPLWYEQAINLQLYICWGCGGSLPLL